MVMPVHITQGTEGIQRRGEVKCHICVYQKNGLLGLFKNSALSLHFFLKFCLHKTEILPRHDTKFSAKEIQVQYALKAIYSTVGVTILWLEPKQF